ncbi:MAG: hypothetical protein E7347_04570 [Clostridiales bacterium]|nr:hypothetical protein [Clostridiales bacterium]
MTIEEIRQDLKDIRYYYEMMELFKNTAKIIPPIATVQKVEKYNKVVEKAPIKLYILYVSLYVNNNSQVTLADDWGLTADYIKKLNTKLCEFFKKEFDKQENN